MYEYIKIILDIVGDMALTVLILIQLQRLKKGLDWYRVGFLTILFLL